jgi:hypothetical protein
MSHRIQQFKLIIAQNPSELEASINEHLKKGFELYGDPGTQALPDGASQFFQAVVLRGEF